MSDVEVRYGAAVALPRTSLSVAPGEAVALMGPSGSGKTTLLDCITGLTTPTYGTVEVMGRPMAGMSAAQRATLRREHLGLIYQSPELLPELDVAENVALTLLFDRTRRSTALAAAQNALSAVGLSEVSKMRPEQLSGGEAQRVAVARALVRETVGLVIADEPTASLDAENARIVTDLLVAQAKDRDAGVLLATHDPAVADRCDRIVTLVHSSHRSEHVEVS
ncbi:ABC transporter ATP-binding protein [Cellulosimicrobium sp. Marseille-Q8652]